MQRCDLGAVGGTQYKCIYIKALTAHSMVCGCIFRTDMCNGVFDGFLLPGATKALLDLPILSPFKSKKWHAAKTCILPSTFCFF